MGRVCVSSCRCCVFRRVGDVSALSICIVLRTFVVVIYMCLLYVSLGSRVSPSIFGLMFMGSVSGQVGLGVGSWPSNRATVLFMLCSAVIVEWLLFKPCCVEMCGILCVMYGSSVFSSGYH